MPNQHLKRQLNVRLDEGAHKLLEKLAKEHGGKAAALEHAIRVASGSNQPSDDALIDMLRERLKARRLPRGEPVDPIERLRETGGRE